MVQAPERLITPRVRPHLYQRPEQEIHYAFSSV